MKHTASCNIKQKTSNGFKKMERRECLWNVLCKEYSKRDVKKYKKKAYSDIAEILKGQSR